MTNNNGSVILGDIKGKLRFLLFLPALSIFLLGLITSGVYSVGPAGEKAFFQLVGDKTQVSLNEEFEVQVLLDTCGGLICAEVSSADVDISYDATQVEALGTTTGNIFDSYFQNTFGDGRVYLAAYSLPPLTYNSFGKTDEQKLFTTIRFKVLKADSPINLTINGTDVTNDFTNVYILPSNTDIFDESMSVDLKLETSSLFPANISLIKIGNTGEIAVGDSIEIGIKINSGGFNTVGSDVIINYDPSMLKVNNILNNSEMYSNFPQQEVTSDQILISGFSKEEPFFSGENNLATINFTALAGGETILSIIFNGQGETTDSNVSFYSPVLVDEDIGPRDLLGSTNNLSLNIYEATTPPTLTPTPTESLTPTPTPTSIPVLPTLTPVACYWNANLDSDTQGIVDSTDLSILVYWWSQDPVNLCPSPDLNHDFIVNTIDVQIMIPFWGTIR